MTPSFYQVGLHGNGRKYTAFTIQGEVYEFLRVPFGTEVSTSALLRALKRIIRHLKFVLNFVDDILILSETFNEHLEHLEILFKKLNDNGVTLNFMKTKFAKSEAEFLGYIITQNGLKEDPEKLERIKKAAQSTSTAVSTRIL